MKNLKYILFGGAILIGGYLLIKPKKETTTTKNLTMSQAEADKIAMQVNDYINKQNGIFGGMNKFTNSIKDTMLKPLYNNGYKYENGKAIKK